MNPGTAPLKNVYKRKFVNFSLTMGLVTRQGQKEEQFAASVSFSCEVSGYIS